MAEGTVKTVVIDGVSVEMEMRDAQIIERAFRKMEDQLRDLSEALDAKSEECESKSEEMNEGKKKAKEEVEKKDAIIVAKDAEIADLKKQLADAELTPEKLDGLVTARSAIVDRARIVLGDAKADFKGKTLNDVRRSVVDKKLGDKAKGWSDAQVEAVFDSFPAEKPDTKSGGFQDAVHAFSQDFSMSDAAQKKVELYDKYDEELSNAWQRQ